MTLWVLLYVTVLSSPGGEAIATSNAVFHSKSACEVAAAKFKIAFCIADPVEAPNK